jgi:hypothetical protein
MAPAGCASTSPDQGVDEAATPTGTVRGSPSEEKAEHKTPLKTPVVPSDRVSTERNQRQSFSHSDGTADVVVTIADQELTEARPAPQMMIGDIRSIRTQHTSRQVKVWLRYVDLRITPHIAFSPRFMVDAVLRSSPAEDRELAFYFGNGDPSTTFWVGDDEVSCRVEHSIDPSTDLVTIGIPRECLGDPASVRIAIDSEVSLFDDVDTRVYDFAFDRGRRPPRPGGTRFFPPIYAP